jgi:CDP-diacylglycerol--glycerol-3-phosphate 3-phosphatidyltransferase
MAIGFFIILGFYDTQGVADWPVLDVAFAVFLVAVLTDVVDGWLARKLGHLTTFGRIADPFVDKIIICGALAYFIGDQFVQMQDTAKVNLTGWRPWMVAVIIARELLVTGMRSFSESHRIPFAASLSGKIKMFIQCVAICWCIFYVEHWTAGPDWTRLVRDALIWTTTLVTAFSGLVYIKRAYDLLRLPPD